VENLTINTTRDNFPVGSRVSDLTSNKCLEACGETRQLSDNTVCGDVTKSSCTNPTARAHASRKSSPLTEQPRYDLGPTSKTMTPCRNTGPRHPRNVAHPDTGRLGRRPAGPD
jgi:hypothetical protein